VFSHEKLNVYQKTLTCVAGLARHSRSWDKRHAVVDHLLGDSESIVLNLAEGARLRGAANRQHFTKDGDQRTFLDIAGASAAKAAAYLDLCCRSGELEQNQRDCGTELLGRVVLMLRALTLC
jgi:hypothetical protein